MIVFLGLFLVLFFAIYILRFQYNIFHLFYMSLKIDGPRALPIVGNGLIFLTDSSTEIFNIIIKLLDEYGEYFRIWLGPQLNVVVSNPKDVEIILSSSRHIDKSPLYDFLKPWLNEGLLLSTGKKWHDRRKVITPAFHFNILEKFAEIFDRLGNSVVDKLKKLDAGVDVEFYQIAVLYALDVMCETAMGVSIDALSKPDSEYVRAVKDIAYVVHTRMHDFILRYQFLFKHSKLAKTHEVALRVLHEFTDDVIRTRRQELLEINQSDNGSYKDDNGDKAIGIRKKRAFLDLLLQSTIEGKPLTDREIREEVDTFMFEGHDTTTSGITFCLYNIAKYPEVQRKCFDEIFEVFGVDTCKAPTTLKEMNQLSYLELTIKESLRLFPSVPYIGRLAKEDIELTKNRIVPSGASIVIPIYYIHRIDKYFKDANLFKPERFLEERSAEKLSSFTYIPFAAGYRNCIGQKFAMYEIKSIVSKILRNFELSLTDESKAFPLLTAELILRPENAINFRLKPRLY